MDESAFDDDGRSIVDFVAAAYHVDGLWRVDALPVTELASVDALERALRAQAPEASDVLGMVSVADDFFVLARVTDSGTRVMISDATAATEWSLAESVADLLDADVPDDDERVEPAGDLGILSDLGLDAMELAALCADLDLYPDEVLRSIGSRLGFADQLDRVIDAEE